MSVSNTNDADHMGTIAVLLTFINRLDAGLYFTPVTSHITLNDLREFHFVRVRLISISYDNYSTIANQLIICYP